MRRERRSFLRRAAALGVGVSLWRAPAQAQERGALVPRRRYFGPPDYANVRLSPDGTQLAYLAPVKGVRNLFVAPVSAPKAGRQVTRVTDRDIRFRYEWAHTSRPIVFFQDRAGDHT